MSNSPIKFRHFYNAGPTGSARDALAWYRARYDGRGAAYWAGWADTPGAVTIAGLHHTHDVLTRLGVAPRPFRAMPWIPLMSERFAIERPDYGIDLRALHLTVARKGLGRILSFPIVLHLDAMIGETTDDTKKDSTQDPE